MEIIHRHQNMVITGDHPTDARKHLVIVESKRTPVSYISNTQGEMLLNMREFVEQRYVGEPVAFTVISLSEKWVAGLDSETMFSRIQTLVRKSLPGMEDDNVGVVVASNNISGKLDRKAMAHLNVVLPDNREGREFAGLTLPIESDMSWALSLDSYIWLPSDNATGGSKEVASQLSGYIIRAMTNVMRGETEGSIVSHMKEYHSGKLSYTIVENKKQFKQFYSSIHKARFLSIDTECTSLNRINNNVLTIQVLAYEQETDTTELWILPVAHEETPWGPKEWKVIAKKLKRFFENECKHQTHVYQNAAFDIHQLMSLLKLEYYAATVYDTQAGAFSLEENAKFLTNYNISAYSLEQMETTMEYTRPKDLVIGKEDRANMASFSLKEISEYGILDVLTPFYIMQQQVKMARRRGYKGFFKLITRQMGAMILAMTEMEHRGIPIDLKYLEEIASPVGSLAEDIRSVAEEISKLPGPVKANDYLLEKHSAFENEGLFGEVKKPQLWDIRTGDHLQLLFFKVLGLEPLAIRDGGNGAIDAPFQTRYRHTPEVAKFTVYQKLTKLKSAFADAIFNFMKTHPDMTDGRLRPHFGYRGVLTGRSCFIGETLVETNDGSSPLNITSKPIKDIKVGDKVWTVKVDTLIRELKTVKASWEVGIKNVMEVHYKFTPTGLNPTTTNHVLTCTPDHRFLRQDKTWVEARHLMRDPVVPLVHSFGPGTLTVVSLKPLELPSRVYDLTVEDNNNFMANQLSVHNSTNSPSTQQIPTHGKYAKRIKRQFAADKTKGRILIKADFSAHEVRVSGNLSGDPAILGAVDTLNRATLKYRLAGKKMLEKAKQHLRASDIHCLNYKTFFDVKIDKSDPRRQDAKVAVFATVYGSKERSIGRQMLGEKLKEIEDKIVTLESELKGR